jgi:hypothetical protein
LKVCIVPIGMAARPMTLTLVNTKQCHRCDLD